MEGHESERYDRLVRFLDGLDNADPNALDEPFRTLWFRIKDVDPGSFIAIPPSKDPITAQSSEFTIDETEPVEVPMIVGKDRRIEVISPSQVGPTFEMKVETKPKVTFKAAGEDEVDSMRRKEAAAKSLLQAQEALAPLKGVGGEVASLFDRSKDMAKLYRDGDYQGVSDVSSSIISTLKDKEFRHRQMVSLQKKIREYEEAGIDIGQAKERFKQLAVSYKEDRDDFASLTGSCNKMAEDAAKAVLGDIEEAEVIVAEIVKPGPAKTVPAPSAGETADALVPPARTPEVSPKGPGPAAIETVKPQKPLVNEVIPQPVIDPQPQSTDDLKPVIKIVKKKLVAIPEEEAIPQPSPGPSPAPTDANAQASAATAPAVPKAGSTPKDAVGPKETKGHQVQEVRSTESQDLQEAYNRISFVYNAATKMHAAGKDVKQLFDLYNFAEEARKKGDNKIYIGVSKQLESMLLSMQSKK